MLTDRRLLILIDRKNSHKAPKVARRRLRKLRQLAAHSR